MVTLILTPFHVLVALFIKTWLQAPLAGSELGGPKPSGDSSGSGKTVAVGKLESVNRDQRIRANTHSFRRSQLTFVQPVEQFIDKLLNEARRIAANIASLPRLACVAPRERSHRREMFWTCAHDGCIRSICQHPS